MSIAKKLTTIAENEEKVYNAGYEKGKAEGEAGDFYDAFWDAYQENGSRTEYNYGFRLGWNNDNFNPKYTPIKPKSANQICAWAKITDYEKLKLFDFSDCTGTCNEAFCVCSGVVKFPPFDFSKTSSLTGCFQHCYNAEEFEKIILNSEGANQLANNTFGICRSLKEIRFEGLIGSETSFASSPLSYESLINITEHLKDFSDTEKTQTLTLGEDNLKKLTDAEKAAATEKGWTLT